MNDMSFKAMIVALLLLGLIVIIVISLLIITVLSNRPSLVTDINSDPRSQPKPSPPTYSSRFGTCQYYYDPNYDYTDDTLVSKPSCLSPWHLTTVSINRTCLTSGCRFDDGQVMTIGQVETKELVLSQQSDVDNLCDSAPSPCVLYCLIATIQRTQGNGQTWYALRYDAASDTIVIGEEQTFYYEWIISRFDAQRFSLYNYLADRYLSNYGLRSSETLWWGPLPVTTSNSFTKDLYPLGIPGIGVDTSSMPNTPVANNLVSNSSYRVNIAGTYALYLYRDSQGRVNYSFASLLQASQVTALVLPSSQEAFINVYRSILAPLTFYSKPPVVDLFY